MPSRFRPRCKKAADRGAAPGARLAWRAAALVLIAAGLLPAAAAARTHVVVMEAVAYAPQALTVKRGDRVRWINRDPFPHTVTARDGSFDSKSIAPGGSWLYRAQRRGSFAYFCTLHTPMSGSLQVE